MAELRVDNLYLERPPTPIGKAERRERIAAMVFAATANDQSLTWEDSADSAIEAANALIAALDAAAEADTKGEVTT